MNNFVYRPAQWLARMLFRIFFRYQLVNTGNLLHFQGGIVAANHVSNFDPPLLGAVLPMVVHYLAKSQLFKNRWFGGLISALNAIPVNRDGIDRRAIAKCAHLLEQGESLVIFPEGGRNRHVAKPGIAALVQATGLPVLPVFLANTARMPFNVLSGPRPRVIFGQPISVEELSGFDHDATGRKAMADFIYRRILETGNEDIAG